MASNENLVRDTYSNSLHEDLRSTSSRANSLEFHYTKKFASQHISPATSVIELGCGAGYYGVYFADKCKEYVGIDLSPENINAFRSKIESGKLRNVKALVGDATKLGNIEDCRFDVVMALGPMYHLPEKERDIVFSECKRICKQGGIIVVAYINKVGVYVKGCLEYPDKYPSKKVNDAVLKQGTDDIRPGLFFFTMPEEIEERAKSHGLTIVKNVGVDFVFNEKLINSMNSEQLEAWMELSDFMCDKQSCAGLSNHAIIICRKQ
jgi:ubiquinone/menaquinone biosynthesis C-methylase UbiE